MKIGIFSTYDDSGAGNAAYKINRAMQIYGVKSYLYVAIKKTTSSIRLKKNFSYNFFFYLRNYINNIIVFLLYRKQSKEGFIS